MVISVLFILFLYFVINNKGKNINNMDNNEKKRYSGYLYYTLYFTILMIIISALCIIIRALAITANMDIGIYVDTTQDQFEEYIAINYIIDITEIVLYSIEICFIIRIKRDVEKPRPIRDSSKDNILVRETAPVPPPQIGPGPNSGVVVIREVQIRQQIISLEAKN